MKTLPVSCVLLLVAGCLSTDEGPTSEVGQAASKKCPDYGCGINSPEIEGEFFHELHLGGAQNAQGFALTGAIKGAALYNIDVQGGRFIARIWFGAVGSPQVLTGQDLVGLELSLRRHGTLRYKAEIKSVRGDTQYWAKVNNTTPSRRIETYTIKVTSLDNGWSAMLCPKPKLSSGLPVVQMTQHSALVFDGDRINGPAKTVSYLPPVLNRWINLGCEGSALAKLELTGHTEVAKLAGFSTTVSQRQTMLKLLAADYCGTGRPFTVGGQRLEWKDAEGTMKLPLFARTQVEARWTSQGAACLQVPRVVAHPTPASDAEFEGNVEWMIFEECFNAGRILPLCEGGSDAGFHLISHNVCPFTGCP